MDKKFEAEKLVLDKRMKFHIIGVTIYSFIVVYTGALVRHMNASLVCRDWPLCINNQLLFQLIYMNGFKWDIELLLELSLFGLVISCI